MKITVNGDTVEIEESTSISKLLELQKVKRPDMVMVRLDDEGVEKDVFDETVLQEGNKVEFLYFMGGG